MTITGHHPTLLDTLWHAESLSSKFLRGVLLAMTGTLLLTISAKVQVPMWPVPMTMQTFVVLALGMAYGWRLGAATLLLYMAEGAMGLPVFAGTPEKGIGLAYMLGGTGGYLIGFVLAAAATGWLAEMGWDRSMLGTTLAMIAGNLIIYVPGVLYLGILFGFDKPILEWGFTPFLLGDTIKIALASMAMPLAWRALGKRGDVS